MIYNVKWLEKKNNDWIVASLTEGATNGTPTAYTEVSINRVNKKGEVFPNFDEIQAGRDVEGELWTSSAGKYYLFAPKERKSPQGGAYKQKMIDDTMTRKEGSIEKFQATKEEAIKLASAQRDAVLIVKELMGSMGISAEPEIKEEIIKWRNWFLSLDFTDHPPFGV